MKRLPILIFLAGICSFYAFSAKSDLIPELSTMKQDTNRVNFVLSRIDQIKYKKSSESISYVLENIQLAKKLKYYKGVAESYKLYGVLLDETGQITKSIEAYRTAQYFYKKINDEVGVAKCLGNIGMLYRDQFRHQEAIDIFKRVLPVFEKHEFLLGLYQIHLNIAIQHTYLLQMDKAKHHIKKAEEYMHICQFEDPSFYGNYANMYLRTGDFKQAIPYYEKALALDPNHHANPTWLDNLSICYLQLGMYKKAIPFLERSIEALPQIYSSGSYVGHLHLAEAYSGVNRFDDAYKTLQIAMDIRDSIFSLDNAQQLSELSKKYETEKKGTVVISK